MIRRELGFFVLNGLISVAIAYAVYRGLVANGLGIVAANGIAYITGMTYGFLANKKLSFRDSSLVSANKVGRYALLHTFTLLVNVGINSMALDATHSIPGNMLVSFLMAISVSTILNFIGLKYWVFSRANAVPHSITKRSITL